MEEIISRYGGDWERISKHRYLTEEFIERYSDRVNWCEVSTYQKLSESFIEKFCDKVDWESISYCQKLSEDFIEKHTDKVDWESISECQKLSEEFMEKFSDKLDWDWISECQKLSESFIEKVSDKVDWEFISKHQQLSEKFIEKHADKVNWIWISEYQILSESFIKKHNLSLPEESWMYWSNEKKEEYIKKNCPEYKIIDGELIAYKATRIDGYSYYNFQYRYEAGKEYCAHADCNPDEKNSFGLSAWTRTGALYLYNKGRLFKVGIKLEDLACIGNYSHIIRARKLRIISEEGF